MTNRLNRFIDACLESKKRGMNEQILHDEVFGINNIEHIAGPGNHYRQYLKEQGHKELFKAA